MCVYVCVYIYTQKTHTHTCFNIYFTHVNTSSFSTYIRLLRSLKQSPSLVFSEGSRIVTSARKFLLIFNLYLQPNRFFWKTLSLSISPYFHLSNSRVHRSNSSWVVQLLLPFLQDHTPICNISTSDLSL